jgi:KaiC/GvpD/RAD55 family RecA-like ATPase/Tfp pilus assembly protein PilF
MGGEVFTAQKHGSGKRSESAPRPNASQSVVVQLVPKEAPPPEDNSDVIAAALDRIRSKAHEEGHRFKPYVRSKGRKHPGPEAKEELANHLDVAVGLLRERRFEEAIEPLLKGIARDDEDRRPWILLAESYLRVGRPYKAAVGYLRALELSPTDDQGWLGLGRVMRSLNELPTAAIVLERATQIHSDHAETWAERGLVLESLKDLPAAATSFARVLELRPDHPLAQAKWSEIETRLGETRTVKTTPEAKQAVEAATAATEAVAEAEMEEDILDDMARDLLAEAAAEPMRSAEKGAAKAPLAPASSSRPTRVRTFVEGLDDAMDGGIPWGHVVLIEGAPGTMKSSLAFSMILQNAARSGLHCVYLSLEERASSLLKQMGSLGLKLEVPKGSLVVLDPRTTSQLLGERKDWVDALREAIRSIQDQRGLDLIAIDSLEALEVLAKFKDRRREMYRLFEWLRDLNVTSFVVTERPDWLIAGHVLQGRWDEDFLADGVLHLRMHMVSDLEAQRRLRVVKMRGTRHETGYLAMVLDEGRFRVTRAIST